MLPNDPRVADLTYIQVDWIIWNLRQESDAMNKALGRGESGGVSDSQGLEAFDGLLAKTEE